MKDSLFDTNVLIDAADPGSEWESWSKAQLAAAASRRQAFINPIIYAEVAAAFPSPAALDRWLEALACNASRCPAKPVGAQAKPT